MNGMYGCKARKGSPRFLGALRVPLRLAALQASLARLDVPVGIVVPQRHVHEPASLAEVVLLQRLADAIHHLMALADGPSLGKAQLPELGRRHGGLHRDGRELLVGNSPERRQLHETARVPQLVREVAVRLDLLHAHWNVLAGRNTRREGVAEGVRAEGIHGLQRINHVPGRLGHLPSLGVPDQPMEIDVLEGRLAGHLLAEHHHSRHPEEENVVPRLQHGGRVELGVVRVFAGLVLRPPQRREGPQAGTKGTQATNGEALLGRG
eukprot:scaffold843_cov255-Pinguiococcus_pyrenoidosus.AAC.8